jgi:demethylspheroidene O-methyltransferase
MSNDNDKLRWRTRWVMQRNAILGSAYFQRWASRMPIIRGIARRRAAAQFDLVAGFVYSQILAAHVESGLIEHLNGQLRSFDSIADFLKLPPDAVERLLRAGESLQLVESPQIGLWTLGEAGAPLSANAGAMAMIRHHHLLYHDLANPLRLLSDNREKQTALSAYWTYASRQDGEGDTAGYSALMSATQPMVTQQILDAYDFTQHHNVLDVGGGTGAFARAIAAAAPNTRVGIFDLPAVLAGASTVGIDLHPGSFKADVVPGGYDLITLVRILHDHDDDIAQALLASIWAALPDGGRLLIVEPMANSAHAERMGNAYFGFYLWAMGSGRPRSSMEIRSMLTKAGFSAVSPVRTALPVIASALVAKK